MVETPARMALLMPSGVDAWAATTRPELAAVWTMVRSSSSENVGRASPLGPQR